MQCCRTGSGRPRTGQAPSHRRELLATAPCRMCSSASPPRLPAGSLPSKQASGTGPSSVHRDTPEPSELSSQCSTNASACPSKGLSVDSPLP
uniref:Uncharacterized protein n=1 Tax=Ulva partita TaxID=1605170 RepID=A0A1C9ZQC0_9CHLO|nr:hypothetical protein [Ulva partita]BAV58231.1 hypothetical protein [Ulva partita]